MVHRSIAHVLAALLLLGCGDDDAATGGGGSAGHGRGLGGEAGQSGRGGGRFCAPGLQLPCYSGPSGTEGIGACVGGTETCNDEGTAFAPCAGQVLPAFENCATAADEDCDEHAPSCTGDHAWSKRFGGDAFDDGRGVATDAGGSVIVTGSFTNAVDFGGGTLETLAGNSDVFVAKLDAAGKHVWSKAFGDAGGQHGQGAAVDAAGNIVVGCRCTGTIDFGGGPLEGEGALDVAIAKLDPSGNHVWSRRFGGPEQTRLEDLTVDADGNVIMTGFFRGTVDFGGGAITSAGWDDVFVAKLDASGNHVFSSGFGSAGAELGYAVTTDRAGNILLTGHLGGSADFGGGTLTGTSGDAFLVKLDPGGAHLWSRHYGEAKPQNGGDIVTDAAGNIYFLGSFQGIIDFGGGPLESAGINDVFLAKLDGAGEHIWSKRFGDFENQNGKYAALDAAGNLTIAGSFESTIDLGGTTLTSIGETDGFVAKLDASGSHLWSRHFGGPGDEYSTALTTDLTGNVLVVSNSSGGIDFGGGMLTSVGFADLFVAKLAP